MYTYIHTYIHIHFRSTMQEYIVDIKWRNRKKKATFSLNNSLPFFSFFTTGTRVAVRYSFATCSSIMQIHMHERCTYNSLSLARVTNAWRFAGSICQLAEKAGEIKREKSGGENERKREREDRRRGRGRTKRSPG